MKEPWLALEPLSLSLPPSLSLPLLSSPPPSLSPSLLPPTSLPVCMGYHSYLWWQAEDLLAAGLLWCSLFCLIWSCLKLPLPWPNRLLFQLVLGRGNGGERKQWREWERNRLDGGGGGVESYLCWVVRWLLMWDTYTVTNWVHEWMEYCLSGGSSLWKWCTCYSARSPCSAPPPPPTPTPALICLLHHSGFFCRSAVA